jgi:hypothetical protein
MPAAHVTDIQLTPKHVSNLTSPDAIAAFLSELGYDTGRRSTLTPESIGLAGDSAAPIRQIDVLAEDHEGFFRVVLVQLRSLTAKSRNDLARVLGKTNVDHLLVLASDFGTLEFVLLQKRRREVRGPVKGTSIQVVPLSVAVERKAPTTKELRLLRRLTWTGRDGLEQFDKLRSTFEAAAFSEEYFCNRALFADHFLLTRLREDPAWRENPALAFQKVRELLADARTRWLEKGEQVVRDELYAPLFAALGFQATVNKPAKDAAIRPDYTLTAADGAGRTAAFVYAWDRWLDGPDHGLDADTPDENPGASVVSALEEGVADWIIVTNGRVWRLYSRNAHSRATNFYEVDLVEALVASGDTDPNEAFRYWWLFFREAAFRPTPDQTAGATPCWLDAIAEGSRDYAKALGERLKNRVFLDIFPHLAQGFLADRKTRLGIKKKPTDEELADAFQATLTLLYRLLFLLYAEARDLLPIREAAYREASLRKLKDEIAERGGIAESEVADRLKKAYSDKEHSLYDRLMRLCAAMDQGDSSLNVPTYNGGLFLTQPLEESADGGAAREQRIGRFLAEHKVPDRFLALALDRLARDPDDKTFALVPIDYKSLEVRHLGSIYEGLLEFKLRVAEEDLTTATEKKKEKYIPLSEAKPKRGKQAAVVVAKGAVYLSNDKAERKASGSYYTPDPIVKYIVEHTVGPVLAEKLEKLRGEFRKTSKTYANELAKLRIPPIPGDITSGRRTIEQAAGDATYNHHKDLVEELFDFRVLDPAMGSGHFLVEAVDYITDKLLAWLTQFDKNPVKFMLDRTRQNILTALAEQPVTVDPEKLTEVNLLKRHVLKRCIYGVDLNPMAVELAKVSLWLDAFTIGAPLSFLDHHLRCGNSLIGATFKDLETATKGQLFGIDYEPLLRAIHHVLYVNKMADATAAEVKQSAREYGEARDELSGYQVVLDLLVAKYFGVPEGVDLLKRGGTDLDLSSRAKFRQSLEDLDALATIERVEVVAGQPHLRFFHWEIEFPEVFFGFADKDQRRLKHKTEIILGSAGFDAVIGNPPYVRMELLKPLKPFLKTHYQCHAERADLFIYFYEKAVELLLRGGRSSFIASSTWTKTEAGRQLRRFLKSEATIVSFLDFGDLPVFPDATTYPCVMVMSHEPATAVDLSAAEAKHEIESAVVPDLDHVDLTHVLAMRKVLVPQNELEDQGWYFEDRRIARLREKIRDVGIPLKDYCGAPLYGIKTGLNEAFVVDSITCERLIAEDRRSKDILRPFLEGKDLKPWRYDWRGLWLIYTHHGIDIAKYPAIKAYLSTFRRRLEARATSESHEWYELQQPQLAYSQRFSEPKIFYPHFSRFNKFSFDSNGYFGNDKTYCIPGSDSYLLGLLNSQTLWFQISQICPAMRGGLWRYELRVQYMETLSVVQASETDRRAIARIAEELTSDSAINRLALEAELNDRVASLYKLTPDERKLLVKVAPAPGPTDAASEED